MILERNFVKNICSSLDIEPRLVLAIAETESGLEPATARFEPRWVYFATPFTFSSKLGITLATERNFQATSWGLMQVMGAVCRELGYDDHLTKLIDPVLNLTYACKKIKQINTKWKARDEIISAYNQGSPVRDDHGKYLNQSYVDKVLHRYHTIT